MDLHSWAIKFQIAWASIALIILWLPNLQFLFIEFQTVKIGLTFYFGISIILTNWNTLKAPTQTQRTN
jgi:hypothetical protein